MRPHVKPDFENWVEENEELLWEEYQQDQEDGLARLSFRAYCEERVQVTEQFEFCDVVFDSADNR